MYQPDKHVLQVIRVPKLLYWVFSLVSVLYNRKYTRGQRLNAQWSPDQIHAMDFTCLNISLFLLDRDVFRRGEDMGRGRMIDVAFEGFFR